MSQLNKIALQELNKIALQELNKIALKELNRLRHNFRTVHNQHLKGINIH
jgi:hypothetical protein